ncbi:MAG: class I SAM-dependent methyltransferase [Prevotella sp.]|nr:class I SAM-dependent methyltransferase [Prevotella sp.]
MEKLQALLREYRRSHPEDLNMAPWSSQYCQMNFPKYWEIVYCILKKMNRRHQIIEIGCGLGDITSILVYLGFKDIISFEKDKEIARRAQRSISELFQKDNIIINGEYPGCNEYDCDILIMVNCAYVTLASSKEEYLNLLKSYYRHAKEPKFFILEVIDSSYKNKDDEFPSYIRLDRNDIEVLFPNTSIHSWVTYKYPENRRSKTLYLIEKK